MSRFDPLPAGSPSLGLKNFRCRLDEDFLETFAFLSDWEPSRKIQKKAFPTGKGFFGNKMLPQRLKLSFNDTKSPEFTRKRLRRHIQFIPRQSRRNEICANNVNEKRSVAPVINRSRGGLWSSNGKLLDNDWNRTRYLGFPTTQSSDIE